MKLATAGERENLARLVASDIENALEIGVDVKVFSDEEKLSKLRNLAERRAVPDWDVFIYNWSGQQTDAPALELHYHFVGANGWLKSGETIEEFEKMSYDIDKFVYDNVLTLFLCSPQSLYAVNKEVDFAPYATTFELAECEVSKNHWSRNQKNRAKKSLTIKFDKGKI